MLLYYLNILKSTNPSTSTMKTFQQHPVGSAAYVVEHAKFASSRGRNPSQPFLGKRDPRKALVSARSILEAQNRYELVNQVAVMVSETLKKEGRDFYSLSDTEIQIIVRGIAETSENQEEFERRLSEELSPDCSPSIHALEALSQNVQAIELCKAMGGLSLKNGMLIQVMLFGPNGIIML